MAGMQHMIRLSLSIDADLKQQETDSQRMFMR